MAAREANGQFAKGHSGNPNGRPKKSREERYMEIALSTCTFADFKRIFQTAVNQAIDGDPKARQFLADYLLGKPVQNVNMKSEGEHALIIEYVNDWRTHQIAESPSGAEAG